MLFCGANKKIYRHVGVQFGGSSFKDAEAQCGESKGSYQRDKLNPGQLVNVWDDISVFVTYDDLLKDVLMTKELTIQWLMKERLIASKQNCAKCGEEMLLMECEDRSDGYRWECRKQAGGRHHKQTLSIH